MHNICLTLNPPAALHWDSPDARSRDAILSDTRSSKGSPRHGIKSLKYCNIMDHNAPKRSTSATRSKPPSRPSTPLRPSSRTSLRDSQTFTPGASKSNFPLESLEPAFAELSDSMADLEANFMHLQLMHESLSRFNESFASFLYGMNMNAFCVDFPEVGSE